MRLGLTYLNAGRYEEAERLFGRLERAHEPASCHALGQFWRAAALGRMGQAKESNALFSVVLKPAGKFPPKDKFRPEFWRVAPGTLLLEHSPDWHRHAGEARRANAEKGVVETAPRVFDRVIRDLEVKK
jgi:hypothetical protein